MQLARIHQYLSMATPLVWTSQADTVGVLGLAINMCAERNGHAEEVDRIRELLEVARDLWRHAGATTSPAGTAPMRAAHVPADPPRRHRGGDRACLSFGRAMVRGTSWMRRVGTSLAEALRETSG